MRISASCVAGGRESSTNGYSPTVSRSKAEPLHVQKPTGSKPKSARKSSRSGIASTIAKWECWTENFAILKGQANTESLGLPLEHAWLVDKEGKVWDATWKDGKDYFGVEIPAEFVMTNMLVTGEAQFLLGKWYGNQIIERLKAQ